MKEILKNPLLVLLMYLLCLYMQDIYKLIVFFLCIYIGIDIIVLRAVFF